MKPKVFAGKFMALTLLAAGVATAQLPAPAPEETAQTGSAAPAAPAPVATPAKPALRPNLLITPRKTTLSKDKKTTGSTIIEKETQAYIIRVDNKSMQPVSGLEVAYRLFVLDDRNDRRASQIEWTTQPGSGQIEAIKPNGFAEMQTIPVDLEKTTLRAGWDYTNEVREKVEDEIKGIWVRISKDGQVVAEYLNPTTLKSKYKWE